MPQLQRTLQILANVTKHMKKMCDNADKRKLLTYISGLGIFAYIYKQQ